jgi:hypothetical protein
MSMKDFYAFSSMQINFIKKYLNLWIHKKP